MRTLNEIFRNEIKIPPGYRVLEMSFETSNAFLIYILSMGDLHCKWGRGEAVVISTGTHPPHMSFINGGDESRTSRRTPELQHPYAWTSSWYTWPENWYNQKNTAHIFLHLYSFVMWMFGLLRGWKIAVVKHSFTALL